MYKHNTNKTSLVLKRFAFCVAVFQVIQYFVDCRVLIQVQLSNEVLTRRLLTDMLLRLCV
jgi:hypothetical protein